MSWTIGNSQNAANQAAATSATVTAPTGITNGDLLIIAIACDIVAGGDPGAPTFPAGFTQITSHFTPALFHGSLRLSWAYKIAASESGNYTVTWTNAAKFSWVSVDISGNKSSSPLDTSASNSSATNTGSLIAPALTGLTGSSDLLLCLFSNTGGANPYTMPAGMTTILNNNQGNSDGVFLGLSYLVLASNANTSTETVTGTGNDIFEAASAAFLAPGGGAAAVNLRTLMGVGT